MTFDVELVERPRTADDPPLIRVRWRENGKRKVAVYRMTFEEFADDKRKEGHVVRLR